MLFVKSLKLELVIINQSALGIAAEILFSDFSLLKRL